MKDNWKLKYDMRWANTSQIIHTILKSRGVEDEEEFLSPSEKNLLPFEFFPNITKGFNLVSESIRENSKILIYGDVDTDGCTAASIMYRYLKNFTPNLDVCINEGKVHGLDVAEVKKYNPDIIIVVDSVNDTSKEYLEVLKFAKLIILDHHIPSDDVLAIKDDICLISSATDNYPNPALSGAGVVWKFCKYLDTKYHTNYADSLADLAATGIVADMCSVGIDSMENRYICNLGFSNLQNPAIKGIMGNYAFNAKAVSFSIAPLINSANRLENNGEALKVFMIDDYHTISNIVSNFKSYKKHQDKKVGEIFESLVKPTVESQSDRKCLFCNVDGDKNFSGLVANKCVGLYHKPTIIYRKDDDGNFSGSMRAVGVADFRSLVNGTGFANCMGHENAAGFSCLKENFEAFKEAIEKELSEIEFDYTTNIDVQLDRCQVNRELVNRLNKINTITGLNFPEIKILISGITGFTLSEMSQKTHMKVQWENMSFIRWKIPTWGDVYEDGEFSGVGTLEGFDWSSSATMILSDYEFINTTAPAVGTLWGVI